MLKQLRSSRLEVPYNVLRKSIQESATPPSPKHVLEHPLLTSLYESLVKQGDFDRSEEVVQEMIDAGLMSSKVAEARTSYTWKDLKCDAGTALPCPREGHALAANRDEVFMFGGCEYHVSCEVVLSNRRLPFLVDGNNELDDLWHATVDGDTIHWEQVSREYPDAPWPQARKGHVMAVDSASMWVFSLVITTVAHTDRSQSHSVLCGAEEASPHRTRVDKSLGESSSSAGSHGLVADDLMDIVEHAVQPIDMREKAQVVWLYDRSDRKWQSVPFPELRFPVCEIDGHKPALEIQQIDSQF